MHYFHAHTKLQIHSVINQIYCTPYIELNFLAWGSYTYSVLLHPCAPVGIKHNYGIPILTKLSMLNIQFFYKYMGKLFHVFNCKCIVKQNVHIWSKCAIYMVKRCVINYGQIWFQNHYARSANAYEHLTMTIYIASRVRLITSNKYMGKV